MEHDYKLANEVCAYLISQKYITYVFSNIKYDLLLFYREHHNTFIFGILFSNRISPLFLDFGCLEKSANGVSLMCWEKILITNNVSKKIDAVVKNGEIDLRREQDVEYLDSAMKPDTVFAYPEHIINEYAKLHSFQLIH